MTQRLLDYGHSVFSPSELFEVLLYYAYPEGDTSQIAQQLIEKFGTVDGVFSASREELLSVPGMYDGAAGLILTAARMLVEGELSQHNRAENIFDDYDETGEYLAKYIAAHENLGVVALLLDGNMRLLDKIELYGVDFGSGAVRSRQFIDAALGVGATVVVFGFTRPHAALFPMPCDMETSRLMSSDLGAVGVRVAECFVTAGSGYLGVNAVTVVRLGSDSEELSRFLNAIKGEKTDG
jgi:DNA repair protein RadC